MGYVRTKGRGNGNAEETMSVRLVSGDLCCSYNNKRSWSSQKQMMSRWAGRAVLCFDNFCPQIPSLTHYALVTSPAVKLIILVSYRNATAHVKSSLIIALLLYQRAKCHPSKKALSSSRRKVKRDTSGTVTRRECSDGKTGALSFTSEILTMMGMFRFRPVSTFVHDTWISKRRKRN